MTTTSKPPTHSSWQQLPIEPEHNCICDICLQDNLTEAFTSPLTADSSGFQLIVCNTCAVIFETIEAWPLAEQFQTNNATDQNLNSEKAINKS